MNGQELNPLFEVNFKHIEDIIDSRKLLGLYNVQKNPNVHSKYAYSQPFFFNDFLQYDESCSSNEGNSSNIRKTDSEITVVRVKISQSSIQKRKIKWDMHDIAIPGDGSHLGESPSLVNLVTLVGDTIPFEGEEYLVPLSSWEPYIKSVETKSLQTINDKDLKEALNESSETPIENGSHSESFISKKSLSWAGKVSNFFKKHNTKESCESSTDFINN